jgi:hypothetical protein
VVKLPQHPAKIFRADYAVECGKAVRDLLTNSPELVSSYSHLFQNHQISSDLRKNIDPRR